MEDGVSTSCSACYIILKGTGLNDFGVKVEREVSYMRLTADPPGLSA